MKNLMQCFTRLLALSCLCCTTAFAQNVNIPDANFKNALLNMVCVDTDGDGSLDGDADTDNNGEISVAEAQAVTALYLQERSISDLTGIASFTNVKTLVCSTNQLTSLNISTLTNLQFLDCYGNRLTNLFLNGLTQLYSLNCGQNQLTALNLTGLVELEYLHCQGNRITALSLTPLRKLSVLSCSENQIQTLNIQGLTNLQSLSYSYNQLSNLNLQSLVNLRVLLCDNNQITSLNLQGLDSLVSISCSGNKLPNLNVQPLAKLRTLNCNNNLLPSLNVQGLTNLIYLNCSSNLLPALNVQGLTNLEVLYCAYNQLPTLNVQGLLKLGELYCSYNPMPTINVQGLTSLYGLVCDGNQMPSLNVQGLNLETLSCSNNKLTNLNVQGLPLRNLYCTDNQLTTLNLQGLNLSNLYCTNNQLTSLNLDSIPYLWVVYCANNQLTSLNLPSVPYLQELNISKNPITNLTMRDNRNLKYLYCHNTQLSCLPMLYDSLRLLLIDSTNITCLPNQPRFLAKTLPLCQPNNPNGCPFSARLYGTAFHDTNQNCTLDSTADAFSENIVIGVRNIVTQDSFKLNCAANGFYEIALPSPATYEVRIVNNSNYWQTCTTQMVTMPTDSAQIEANIGMRALVPCADMNINHQLVNIVRPCSTAVYKIACFNAGTIDAIGTVVSVQLPPELSVLSATRPYVRANNNTFRIALPNVKPLARDTFSFSVAVACSAVMGQMLCTEVKVSPHTYCNTDNKDWDGSDIMLSGRCIGNDSIRFVLRNTGQGGMTTGRNYTVIEDNIMIRGNSFQLSPNAADSITVSADPQKIYRIIADEAPNNPSGAIHETFMVWGCGGITPQIHWGFVNQFGLNNGVSNPHQLCSEVRTSYDPNDISAVAEGIGEAHYILKDTDLEYKIRFQNTGNDTAFVVVVTDTLPAQLDMRTFRIGVASHPFTWSADSDRTLRFTFKNILLVDSMTNEPKSHGFITYRVKTQPNLSIGTTINNQAHIYFDANKPIHTNIYTHTIGENLSKILLTTIKIIDIDYTVSVAPNPMGDYTKIVLNSKNNTLDTENIDFTLYNALGQTIKNERFTNQNIILNRSDLAQGIYFYTINEGNKRIAQGKLVVP